MKKKCAIIGWEEGLAGQVSTWLNYDVNYFIYPFKKFPKLDLKKIKSKPSKSFEYPKNEKYLKKNFICSKDWIKFLKKKKIKNIFILVSNNALRLSLIKKAKKFNLKVLNAIHKTAVISKFVKIGDGVVIEPLTFVGYKAELEDGALIQEKASIDHGSVLKKCSTVNPGAIITGNCLIGSNTIIHTGTIVINNIKIGKNCVVGAGSLVLKNIPSNTVSWGSPCQVKKKIK
tara:strand:- start:245 stop:934 length:690 start_codon:yes stop_codon:yes gene_type:complete